MRLFTICVPVRMHVCACFRFKHAQGFGKILHINHVSDKELMLEEFEFLSTGTAGQSFLDHRGQLDFDNFVMAMVCIYMHEHSSALVL